MARVGFYADFPLMSWIIDSIVLTTVRVVWGYVLNIKLLMIRMNYAIM